MRTGWHTIVVRVPLGHNRASGILALRRIERWMAANHRPMPLFHPDGCPRSEAVCLAVPAERADLALAYRAFCRELGLSGSLVQWNVEALHPPGAAGSEHANQ